MIRNGQELHATQERIAYFQQLLEQFRVTTAREEFLFVARGYSAEIVRMQEEVLEYLTRHASEAAPAGLPDGARAS